MKTTHYKYGSTPSYQCRAGQASTLNKCRRYNLARHGKASLVMFYHSPEEACAKAGLE